MNDQQCSRLSWTDPVGQAQQVFRLALTALSRPARTYRFAPCPADAAAEELPAGLSPELAALALSLCDNETAVWLAPGLDTENVRAWFRFHCGAVLVSEPSQAAFAFVPGTEALPDLRCFHQGEAEYPDRSTTVCLGGVEEEKTAGITAAGPGIVESCIFSCRMPAGFLAQWRSNHEQFPLGVDMLLCGPGRLTGLPRTTCLTPAADEVSPCM